MWMPKGNVKSRTIIMPGNIRNKIKERNYLRERDPDNKELCKINENIKNISKYEKKLWKEAVYLREQSSKKTLPPAGEG